MKADPPVNMEINLFDWHWAVFFSLHQYKTVYYFPKDLLSFSFISSFLLFNSISELFKCICIFEKQQFIISSLFFFGYRSLWPVRAGKCWNERLMTWVSKREKKQHLLTPASVIKKIKSCQPKSYHDRFLYKNVSFGPFPGTWKQLYSGSGTLFWTVRSIST